MSDLPKFVKIHEEGPREGFQIEPGPIATARKVEFIEALAETGLKQIDCVSFVNAQKVPGMADAEEVIRAVRRKPGVRYTGLWLNTRGLLRALETPADIVGSIRVTASETFCIKNTGMNHAQTLRRAAQMAADLPREERARGMGLCDDRVRLQLRRLHLR